MAARLAAHKQQAAGNSDTEEEANGEGEDQESQWSSNPFVIAGIDDDAEGGHSAFPDNDFGPNAERTFSPTFPETEFSPPESPSTNSSDEEGDGYAESVRRRVRVPLEVEEDDDDEMGEMVGPSASGMIDSDDEDEAIINESLGYSNLPPPSRYNGFRHSRTVSSHFDDDDHNDSSDGEDDGLVEILVPSRKPSASH